ncbi:hypothetical protein ACFVUY_16005 [Kitasatospora sp. NPDC058063]|uniref:hypothetical protein n=1 Tax=unclassified Kitasatospora TaxID=2633591 RepID=UPI0036DB8402
MGSGTEMTGDGRPTVLVRDVVRSVVETLAPEELFLVEGLRRFDDATVVRRLSRGGGRHEPLGFGIGEVAALVTPVVWLVLDEVAQRMVATTVDRASRGATGLVRRLFRRPAPAAELQPLTQEQLVEVRALLLTAGEQRGLAPDLTEEIADRVVARLALSRALDPPTPPTPPAAEPPTDPTGTGQD